MELGFTPAWFEAKVLSSESAAEFAAYAVEDPAKPARHWRWMAFRDYAEERTPLDEAECRALFRLAESEPDPNLATSMMCCMLYQKECPADMRDAAAIGARESVRRAAKFRRAGSSR